MKVQLRICALILSLVLAFVSVTMPASATEISRDLIDNLPDNYHVSTVDPRNALLERGTESPTVGYDISQGYDDIKGNAAYSTLYTKYLYYGTRYYKVELTNLASTPLRFSGNDATYYGSQAVITLGAYESKTYFFELLPNKNYFSMTFYAPSHFTGTIYDGEPLN